MNKKKLIFRNYKYFYQACWAGVTGVSSFFSAGFSSLGGLLPPLPPRPPVLSAPLSPVGAFSRSRLTLLTLPLSSRNSYCLFSSFLKLEKILLPC